MKLKSELFLMVFLSTLIISCAVVKAPLPLNSRKPILSQEEIKKLEQTEDSLTESKFQLLVLEQKSDTAKQAHVSNIFVDMDIKAILMDIATQTGINIIPDNSVEGTISLTLKNVPIEKAFDMILYPGGYKYRYITEGQYYIVGKSLPENSSFDKLTITKTIKTNRGADKILSQISSFYLPFIKADGQTITITATPDIVNRLERDVALIDKSKRQIEISAQFVMIEWSKGKNLGAQWGDINLSALGIANIIGGGITGLTSTLSSALSAVLTANGYDTKIKSIAEPRIVVEDGEHAELNITEEHLFLILSGGGPAYNYFTTKEVAVGIKLKVQPFVTRDNQIRLSINPEVSDIVGQTEFKQSSGPTQMLPIIARRATETILKVKNGETIAIGGLITKLSQEKKSGIPFFRKIPIIGLIFGNKNKSLKETELVIFITSKVIG